MSVKSSLTVKKISIFINIANSANSKTLSIYNLDNIDDIFFNK